MTNISVGSSSFPSRPDVQSTSSSRLNNNPLSRADSDDSSVLSAISVIDTANDKDSMSELTNNLVDAAMRWVGGVAEKNGIDLHKVSPVKAGAVAGAFVGSLIGACTGGFMGAGIGVLVGGAIGAVGGYIYKSMHAAPEAGSDMTFMERVKALPANLYNSVFEDVGSTFKSMKENPLTTLGVVAVGALSFASLPLLGGITLIGLPVAASVAVYKAHRDENTATNPPENIINPPSASEESDISIEENEVIAGSGASSQVEI